MKVQFYEIISVTAILSYFIPLLMVMFKNLWRDLFFLLFAGYWALGGLVNLTDLWPGLPLSTKSMIGIYYNMLDFPFILAILHFTTTSILVKRYASFAIVLFLGIEIISAIYNGINYNALKYTLGLGIFLVLVVLIWEIVRYLQKLEHSNRQTAKFYIYSALLFEYGTSMVIYIFDYFIYNSTSRDALLIYYISTLIAIFIATGGYLVVKLKNKKDLSEAKIMDW